MFPCNDIVANAIHKEFSREIIFFVHYINNAKTFLEIICVTFVVKFVNIYNIFLFAICIYLVSQARALLQELTVILKV